MHTSSKGGYLDILLRKLKDVFLAVLPITALVIILDIAFVPVSPDMMARFLLGSACVVLGLGIFLFGANIGVGPLGVMIGESLAKSNRAWVVGVLGFILGTLITIAEPDMQILARQVQIASGGVIPGALTLIVVAIGVGVLVATGLLRILYEKPIKWFFAIVYFLIFLLGLKVAEEFLAIAVDSSGATTGSMSTPFILALGLGVSQLKGGKKAEEDSFGLVGMASAGPILAIMITSIVKGLSGIEGQPEQFVVHSGVFGLYLEVLPDLLKESLITLAPLLLVFLLFNHFSFKLSKNSRNNVLKGLFFSLLGLTLFMTGVNAGFMELGRVMGEEIAKQIPWLLPVVGFFLGMVVVLAEPAVYVLTEQVENVTAGHIKRKAILVVLSIGIAFAVAMAMIRILVPGLKLWHMLLPGFGIAAILAFRVPPIFVGIAYDSGGVASGPMTATFILAFAQGASKAVPGSNIMTDSFGVIAMVAMTPLVAIQILGLVFQLKEKRIARLSAGSEGKND